MRTPIAQNFGDPDLGYYVKQLICRPYVTWASTCARVGNASVFLIIHEHDLVIQWKYDERDSRGMDDFG